MKHPLWLLAFVACSGAPLLGTIIPLSQTALTRVSGSVSVIPSHGGYTDSYAEIRDEAWSGASYSANLSGTASATADPQPGWVYYLPLNYVASSSAQQTAVVSSNGIELTGNAVAQSGAHAQVGFLSASGRVFSEMTFRVTEAEVFSLSVASSYAHFHPLGPITASPDFSLRALDGSLLLTTADLTASGGFFRSWNTQQSLLLAPGDYRLAYGIQTMGLTSDPLGDGSSASMQIRLTAVPDDGGAVTLLGLGLGALVLLTSGRRVMVVPS